MADIADAIREGITAKRGPSFDPTHCSLGEAHELAARIPSSESQRSLRVKVPSGRKSDDFYERVAVAYASAANVHAEPVQAIANASQVAREEVYAWLKEARRRRLLPPARRSRRT